MEGREIRLGALTFIADDSAWLQEAPLDIDALPVRGATHFRACVRGVLTPRWSPVQTFRSVASLAVGEARGGPPASHPTSRGNRAR